MHARIRIADLSAERVCDDLRARCARLDQSHVPSSIGNLIYTPAAADSLRGRSTYTAGHGHRTC